MYSVINILLQFTSSNYPFGIFKLFIIYSQRVSHVEQEYTSMLSGIFSFCILFVDPCSFFLFRPLCGLFAFNVLLQSTSLVSSNSSSYAHPRRVSHIEQELRTLPEHLSSPTGFSGIRVACSIFFVYITGHSFCFDHCFVCP